MWCFPRTGSDLIIQRRALVHCSSGPSWCEECKELAKYKKICLVRIYSLSPEPTRSTDLFIIKGREQKMEFEIEKVFEKEEEARAHAIENLIPIDI